MTTKVNLDENIARRLLGDPETSGVALLTIVLHEFGDAVFGSDEVEQEDIESIWAGIKDRYNVWVSEEGENKINAMITGLEGARFWRDMDTFMAVTTALLDGDLGDIIDVGFEDLSAAEIMWAIVEMGLAWDDGETPEFHQDIRDYINEVMNEEQEHQEDNFIEVEKSYLLTLEQLRKLGVPSSILREWDAEYADVTQELEDNAI